jgi:hypothetical protein
MSIDNKLAIVIENNREIEELLLTGAGMSVGICISDKYKSVEMIIGDTKLPLLKVKLVLNKFIEFGIVDSLEKKNANGIIEKYYKLVPSRVDFVYDNKTANIADMISFFSEGTGRILRALSDGIGTGLARHISIRANEKDMMHFLDELELLIEQYNRLEDHDMEDVYSLIVALGKSN